MAAPITVLGIAQGALEATRGTAVPATAVLDTEPGGVVLSRDPSLIRVRRAGSLATAHRSYPGRDAVGVEVKGTWSFDWAPWWLNLFLGPLAAGTGAGADKTWTFGSAVVSDTADNLKTATLEVGGRDSWPQEHKVSGCMGQKLSIAIREGAAWTFSASLVAQAVAVAAKTGGKSPLSGIVDVLGTTTRVYVDDSGSAFGTTQRSGTVVSADVDIEVGSAARYMVDGTRGAGRVAVTGPRKVSAKLVVEWDATADYAAAHAATAQRLRVEATGPTLGGSAYRQTLDIPGVWESFSLGDSDGVVTSELVLAGQWDAAPAADIGAVVVNASASLP